MCCFEHGDQGGTFNGNPLMAAVGCAVVETVGQPGFWRRARDRRLPGRAAASAVGRARLRRGARPRPAAGAGAERRDIAAEVADAALERGLLINAPRPDSLRFMPALTVTRAEVDRMIGLLEGCLA